MIHPTIPNSPQIWLKNFERWFNCVSLRKTISNYLPILIEPSRMIFLIGEHTLPQLMFYHHVPSQCFLSPIIRVYFRESFRCHKTNRHNRLCSVRYREIMEIKRHRFSDIHDALPASNVLCLQVCNAWMNVRDIQIVCFIAQMFFLLLKRYAVMWALPVSVRSFNAYAMTFADCCVLLAGSFNVLLQ